MISVENKYLFLILLILGILFYNIKKYETKNRLCHMGIISKKSNIFYQSTYLRYKLEKEALLLIQKNFKCVCKNKNYHFPKILNYDDNKYKLYLSINGISLNKYKSFLKLNINEKIKIKNKEEQINCIIHNLNKCKIKYIDLKPANVCINNKGIISLIDFDLCVINDNPPLRIFSNVEGAYKKYKNYNETDFRKKFINLFKYY